jgi:hypothetical protein
MEADEIVPMAKRTDPPKSKSKKQTVTADEVSIRIDTLFEAASEVFLEVCA